MLAYTGERCEIKLLTILKTGKFLPLKVIAASNGITDIFHLGLLKLFIKWRSTRMRFYIGSGT
jgi:hypothetical protein